MYTFEIEDDQFKFCKAEFKEGKFLISKLGVFERPFQSSVLKELQDILSEIERPVIFAVPRRKVSVHYHSFPSQREEEINQMARFQALRQFPYRELSVVHSADILKNISDGYSKVALTVVGEDILNRYLEDVKSFILPDKITVNSLGVFGFYKMARPGRDAVVVDLDNRFSNLCVVGAGKLLFCREINKGFYFIRDNGVDSWLDEIMNSVSSFNKEGLYKNIEDLAVLGPEYINTLKKTNLPFKNVEFIRQEYFIKKEDDFKFYGYNREKAYSLIKVLGLSAVDKLDIDLTPVSLAQALLKQGVFKQRKDMLTYFALAFLGIALLTGWEYQRKKIYLNRLDIFLNSVAGSVKVLQERSSVNNLFLKKSGDAVFLDLFKEIVSIMPHGVTLTRVNYEKAESLSLEGRAEESSPVYEFYERLKYSKIAKNLEGFKVSSTSGRENIFYLKIILR